MLTRQPRTDAEARATAISLQQQGWDFSAGPAQINQRNFERLGLSVFTVFDPCATDMSNACNEAPDGAPVQYERHRPEQTTLYRLVQQHAATFFAEVEAPTPESTCRSL